MNRRVWFTITIKESSNKWNTKDEIPDIIIEKE